MDKESFDKIEARLLEVNKVIEKLDASIRLAAFDFLKPYIAGGLLPAPPANGANREGYGDARSPAAVPSLADLVDKHGSTDKPSDNAKLLSSWWFSQYGSAAFTTKWIQDTAASTGLTVPAQLGMTFKQAKEDGKALYKPLGRGGLVEPTVTGESFFQKIYGVRKGTKTPPDNDGKAK